MYRTVHGFDIDKRGNMNMRTSIFLLSRHSQDWCKVKRGERHLLLYDDLEDLFRLVDIASIPRMLRSVKEEGLVGGRVCSLFLGCVPYDGISYLDGMWNLTINDYIE